MQSDAHDEPVHLGFALNIDNKNLYQLRSQFLPLGKIGGKPSWLNPKNIPKSDDLKCTVCGKQMCFLLQIYAPTSDNPPEHAFHRTLFLFICRDPACSASNNSANILALRCCLPRKNDFYSFDGPMDPDLDGDVPDPRSPSDVHLCAICGCYASKKCAKCGVAWYCCRDHQALDWTSCHKVQCGKVQEPVPAEETPNPANAFVFEEYGIEMDREYLPANLFDGISDDEDDDGDGVDSDDETNEDRQRRMKEFEKFVEKNRGVNDDITSEDCEAAVEDQKNDVLFEKFQRLITLNSDQILRYKRCGEPLLATSRAPAPPEEIPSCESCGGPRRFEFQITPHLLSLIGVDCIGHSIDWASVLVYTCAGTCEIADQSYAKEFVFKQDFA